jgi:hypothetical protein
MKRLNPLAALVLLAIAGAAHAATDAQAQALGKDLTPLGAEKAANKDGSIPAWSGGELKAPAGWKPGTPRPDPMRPTSRCTRSTPATPTSTRST